LDNNKRKLKYIKSNSFQSYTASGLVGGVTPAGKVRLNFYEDLPVLPDSTELEINLNNGQILGEAQNVDKEFSSVREFNCGISLDIAVAKSIHVWLGQTIKQFEAMNNPDKKI